MAVTKYCTRCLSYLILFIPPNSISQVGKSTLKNEIELAWCQARLGELGLNPGVCPQELL